MKHSLIMKQNSNEMGEITNSAHILWVKTRYRSNIIGSTYIEWDPSEDRLYQEQSVRSTSHFGTLKENTLMHQYGSCLEAR